MDMNRLTQKSIEALKDAERIAIDHNHMEIEPDHLMLALLAAMVLSTLITVAVTALVMQWVIRRQRGVRRDG